MPVVRPLKLKDTSAIGQRAARAKPVAAKPVNVRKPFLTVHGNVMYDYYYQSHVDTPFVEKDVHQHTVQTSLEITVRDLYPLRLSYSTSKGNSAYFRNLTGLNLGYTNRDFRNHVIRKAEQWNAGRKNDLLSLQRLKDSMDLQWLEVNKLRGWLSDPGWKQRLVELREKELYGKGPSAELPDLSLLRSGSFLSGRRKMFAGRRKPDTGAADSLQRLNARLDSARHRLDSLQNKLAATEKKYRAQLSGISEKKKQFVRILKGTRNSRELAEKLGSLNMPDSVLPKGYKALLSLRSAGIGRTMVDYSELTVKNVSVLGVQAEYNPSWYLAFATGSVDYRFRDFTESTNRLRQYLSIVRAGFGMRDGNNIILSVYGGKRQLYNLNTDQSGQNMQQPDYRIMGVSLEGRWQLGKNHAVTGEIAKSSMPYYMRNSEHGGASGGVLQFSDHSNEAYALKTSSFIPATGTRVTGMFKRMGSNFQSFSTYTSGNTQNAWMMQADQPFFDRQLTITAGIRKNVFESQFQNAGYMSNTVFKSIQATFRRKKLPVVSVGYFPSSQLMKLGKDEYMENMFYTLVGSVSHLYSYGGVSMSTMLSATRFYNRQADSNFVYFNSTNLMLTHTMFLGKLTLNGTLSSAMNQDYALHGADGSVQYEMFSWLGFGGGLKYNYQTVFRKRQMGYMANLRVAVPHVGEIGLMADKSFVPGANQQLVENQSGRLTYTRIF